jgi:hypothetical protein
MSGWKPPTSGFLNPFANEFMFFGRVAFFSHVLVIISIIPSMGLMEFGVYDCSDNNIDEDSNCIQSLGGHRQLILDSRKDRFGEKFSFKNPVFWAERWQADWVDTWQGETDRFTHKLENDISYLQLQGEASAGLHRIYRESEVVYGAWEFSVEFDGFTSSNQNRAWLWLAVDDIESPVGYSVRIGENGSQKYVRIYRLRGDLAAVELLRSQIVIPESGPIKVRVERDVNNLWRLGIFSESDFVWSEVIDSEPYLFSRYFGIQANFTTTRADKFKFGPISVEKEPLFVVKSEFIQPNIYEIHFSEELPIDYWMSSINVRINGIEVESKHFVQANKLVLAIENLSISGPINITISGLYDPHDNKLLPNLTEIIVRFDEPSMMDVVINEFSPRPVSGEAPRFIELYNRSEKYLNIEGWEFGRQNLNGVKLTGNGSGLVLSPGGFVIVSPNADYFQGNTNERGRAADGGIWGRDVVVGGGGENQVDAPVELLRVNVNIPTLGRTQDVIWIRDGNGNTIDSLTYDSNWTTNLSDGSSLERMDVWYASGDWRNWVRRESGNSAGFANTSAQEIMLEPELLSAVLLENGELVLEFGSVVEGGNAARIRVGGEEVVGQVWPVWGGTELRVGVDINAHWFRNSQAFIEVENIRRFGGLQEFTYQSEIAQPVKFGDVIINEIMYQPLQGRYNNFSDQSEYVEILNLQDFRISLHNVHLHDTPDRDNMVRTWDLADKNNFLVNKNGYAVIFADTSSRLEETRIVRFFGLSDFENLGQVTRSTLGFSSSGRGIYLATKSGEILDSVYYSPNWHHPFVSDPRGLSLERISNNEPNIGSNWSTSAHPLGGTPGLRNSIELQSKPNTEKIGISLSSNPFSPDLDGREDHLEITINFPHPGYTVTTRIFDRFGRRVRTISRDHYSGNTMVSLWDGRDSQQNVCETGVYIIHVVANHSDQNPTVEYKEAVVLVRRR